MFLPVTEKTIYSGNIEDISTKEKSKFPQEFFPEVIIKNTNLHKIHLMYLEGSKLN